MRFIDQKPASFEGLGPGIVSPCPECGTPDANLRGPLPEGSKANNRPGTPDELLCEECGWSVWLVDGVAVERGD